VDDEWSGKHGLEGGGVAVLCTPGKVVLEVVPLRPLRDAGDVIRVVLISYDPDDLAAIELNASPNISMRRLATSSPRPGSA
jgi:hypothetical protein